MIPNNKLIINLINKSSKKIALKSKVTISNDTSAMHFISYLNLPVIAIMNDNKYALRNYPKNHHSKFSNIKILKNSVAINALSEYI